MGEELAEARWVTPARALAEFATGGMGFLPPTVHTLRRLDGFPTADGIRRALRVVPAPTFLPCIRPGPDGVVEMGG